jgi:hypothetical protein
MEDALLSGIFFAITKEYIFKKTYFFKISPGPSFPKRGIPPLGKGREG